MADLASTRIFGKLTVMHEAIVKANAEIVGSVTAASFSGDGSALTALNASALASGTVAEARLPASALVGDTTYAAGTGLSLSGTTFSLSDERFTSALLTKLNGIEAGAQVNVVTSVAGKTGAVTLASTDVGLGSVRNVSSYSQTEADGRFAPISHGHTLSEISDSGSAAALDAPSTGDATATQVVKGDDSRLTDARAPTSHTHLWADITDKPTTFTPSSHGHDVADITGLSDAATTTVATIRSGTTKSNVGLPNVKNVALNWSWGSGTPTHIWGSQGDSTNSYVYNATDLKNFLGLTKSDVGLGSVRNVSSYSQGEANGRFVQLSSNNVNFEYEGAGLKIRTNDNNGSFIFQCRSSGQAERFTVQHGTTELKGHSNGNWGIGVTTPSQRLHVSGQILATSNITAYSDLRLKENIERISDPLDKVGRLSGYTFNKIGEGSRDTGVIAQEVLEVLPEAVKEQNDGHYSVAYGNMVGLLIEAVKEERSKREALEERLDHFIKIMEV